MATQEGPRKGDLARVTSQGGPRKRELARGTSQELATNELHQKGWTR